MIRNIALSNMWQELYINSSLSKLDLSNNKIKDPGAKPIAEAFKFFYII